VNISQTFHNHPVVLKAGSLVGGDLVLRAQLVVLLDHLARGVLLGDAFVGLGCQAKEPLQVVLVGLLATLLPTFGHARPLAA
jgi:hypothetical protein